jgi:hypothetical protein
VGEGLAAMPDPGDSRGKAHGGGSGATPTVSPIPSSRASEPPDDDGRRTRPGQETRPRPERPHILGHGPPAASPGPACPSVLLPQGEKDSGSRPLHRRSALPLPHAFGAGEGKITPPDARSPRR